MYFSFRIYCCLLFRASQFHFSFSPQIYLFASKQYLPSDLTVHITASYNSPLNGEPRVVAIPVAVPLMMACRPKPPVKSAPCKGERFSLNLVEQLFWFALSLSVFYFTIVVVACLFVCFFVVFLFFSSYLWYWRHARCSADGIVRRVFVFVQVFSAVLAIINVCIMWLMITIYIHYTPLEWCVFWDFMVLSITSSSSSSLLLL